MKIATWNINSVRLRMPLLKKLVEEVQPDVVCLQEIKVEDALFPHESVRELGFAHAAVSGQKGYHGVAILSKVPLANPQSLALLNDEAKRHIAVTLPDGSRLHNFYVPAGGDIPDRIENPYYGFKLDYIDAMTEWFSKNTQANERAIVVGDFNVAPHEQDVWSHKQLLKIVSHTPDETQRLIKLQQSLAWVDAARHFTPVSEKLYTWWSYRNRDWKASNRGRRLDHIWLTPKLKPALKQCDTLVHARDWPQPSDHVPVIIDLAA